MVTRVAAIIITSLTLALPLQAVEQASWGGVKQLFVSRADDGTVYVAFTPEAAAKKPPRLDETPAPTETSTTETSTSETSTTTESADLSADETRSITRTVYPRGKSRLYLSDLNGDGLDDDLYVSFGVPSGAVDAEVAVTMTVIGNRLSDLIIAFQPGGLVFNTPATLWVQMGTDLVDVDTSALTVWHEYTNGTVEVDTLQASKVFTKGSYEFEAAIPGFSRYGLRF